MAWTSSVLVCDAGDDECEICRFLAGDRSPDVLLEVIGVLDSKLAELEEHNRVLDFWLTKAFGVINHSR